MQGGGGPAENYLRFFLQRQQRRMRPDGSERRSKTQKERTAKISMDRFPKRFCIYMQGGGGRLSIICAFFAAAPHAQPRRMS